MTLQCLVVSDTATIELEINKTIASSRIDITNVSADRCFSGHPLNPSSNVVILAVDSCDRVLLLAEQIAQTIPEATIVFVFDPMREYLAFFFKTIEGMVDSMVGLGDLDRITDLIDEMYRAKYHAIERNFTSATFDDREFDVMAAIQQDLPSEEICKRLEISSRTLQTCVTEIAGKLECRGKGSIGVRSLFIFGDLSQRLNR
jgi:DNA-binding CsgD family transcriptional regulator